MSTPNEIFAAISALADDVAMLLDEPGDPDEHRYTKGSLDLLALERDRLGDSLRDSRGDAVTFALRSLGGMMKGLLDIGPSWITERPDLLLRARTIIDASRDLALRNFGRPPT